MDELYRSDNLVVRRIAGDDPTRWVVTFDNHSIGEGFDRPGFGERFLRGAGVSAIHMLGRGNDWYQYPDLPAALEAARIALAGARRIVTYGSSMGGYAALRSAAVLGADAFALSPQWTINPAKAAWEKRWRQDARRIDWLESIDGPIARPHDAVVIYDPATMDRLHVDRIAEEIPVQRVTLPHTGHPATTFLGEANLLGSGLLEYLQGTFRPRRFRRQARWRRRRSGTYLAELAERQPAVRPLLAIRLARRAVRFAPDNALAILGLARQLTRMGEHDEALAAYANAADLGSRYIGYLVPYAEGLIAAERLPEAVAIGEEVVAQSPGVAHLRHWLAWLLWRDGRAEAAVAEEEIAAALDPRERNYAKTLSKYRVEAKRLRKAGARQA